MRILNASNFRAYNLFFEGPAAPPMSQIATESGLMPEALSRDKILLGPGERAELIVDFAAAQGEALVLRSGPREDGENASARSPSTVPSCSSGSRTRALRTKPPRRRISICHRCRPGPRP